MDNNDDLNVTVKVSDDLELITLMFESKERQLKIGFNIQEAQTLSFMINEAITDALLGKLQIPPPSETQH